MENDNSNSRVKIHSKTVNPDGSTTIVTSSKLPKWFVENRKPTKQERLDDVRFSLDLLFKMLTFYEKESTPRALEKQEGVKKTIREYEEWIAELEAELSGRSK